jgi:hypothetical protein
MFKYFYSKMKYTDPWKEIRSHDVEEFIHNYIRDKYHVHDADNCGDHEYEFVIMKDGETKLYILMHSWWITYDPEWEMHNEYTLEEVKEVKMKYPSPNRDWLDVSSFKFRHGIYGRF